MGIPYNYLNMTVELEKIDFVQLRQELGLTQSEMAAFLGINQAEISKIEKKRVIPVWLIRAIKLDQALGKIGKRAIDLDI